MGGAETRLALEKLGVEVLGREERSPFGPVLKVRATVGEPGGAGRAERGAGNRAGPHARARQRPEPRHAGRRRRPGLARQLPRPDRQQCPGQHQRLRRGRKPAGPVGPGLVRCAGRRRGHQRPRHACRRHHRRQRLESTTVSNAPGSLMPAVDFQFRGLAPAAQLFSMRL